MKRIIKASSNNDRLSDDQLWTIISDAFWQTGISATLTNERGKGSWTFADNLNNVYVDLSDFDVRNIVSYAQRIANNDKNKLNKIIFDEIMKHNTAKSNVSSSKRIMNDCDIMASTHSASDLAKFIEESVDNLLAGTATNNQYKLDNDWAVYVGWSDAGYTDDFESVIHDENDPDWTICAKIATTHEAVWADYDFCDMPYNEKTGDVWDTDMAISPEENYQNTAAWLLDEYNELIRQIESGEFVPHEYN